MDNPDIVYLNISQSKQKDLMNFFKLKSKLTCKRLFTLLGVSKSCFLLYSKGNCRLPYRNFLKLCNLTNTPVDTFGVLPTIIIKNKPVHISKPETNDELVELLGILYGDGGLTKKYSVHVACNAVSDKKYVLSRVVFLFKKLFNVTPHIIIRSHPCVIECRVYSKELYDFFCY